MTEGNGNGRKLEWFYRAAVLGLLSWLILRVEGIDALEARLSAFASETSRQWVVQDRRDDAQDRRSERIEDRLVIRR